MTFFAPGTVIDGRYEVLATLGRGGYGVVCQARDLGLDRHVALKMLTPESNANPVVTRAFQREARLLATLRDRHVVAVYAFGSHEGAYYMAMEWVDGDSLDRIIHHHHSSGATVPVRRAAAILAHVASGLAVAHAAGIVHHDVKPANVMIESDTGRPVLIDFGVATAGPDQADETAAGTPHYLAPEEQARSTDRAKWNPRADVYSFGCMMVEVFTGRPPFADADGLQDLLHRHRSAPIPRVSEQRPEIEPFDAVIQRAMAKDRTLRFPSALELAAAIDFATIEWRERVERASSSRPISVDEDGAPAANYLPIAREVVRVLVVDDDPDFLKFATRAVQIAFYGRPIEVVRVGSGPQAIASARRKPPHLLLLDYDMPGLDGIATLTQLRSSPHGEAMRVIVISARAAESARWKFSVLGVRNYLHKPVQLQELVGRVQDIARRSGWLDDAPAP